VKDAGVWDNTVFIVTSDHGDMQMEKQQFYIFIFILILILILILGDMQMEKQQFYKMVPYEASSSVPMVIYDGRAGRQYSKSQIIKNTTQLIDIFPTVLDLASVPVTQRPNTLDGKSLLPFMKNSGTEDENVERPRYAPT